MDDSTKSIVKVVALVGGALALYWWLQRSGYWALWFGGPVVGAPVTQPTGLPVITTPPVTIPAQQPQGLPASYSQAAIAMQGSAGAPTQDFDQWSYWWQNTPAFTGAPAGFGSNGSISPTLIDAMIAAGGGDRSVLISAQQWVGLLWGQQQKGVSGFGALFAQAATPQYGWVN